MKTKNSNTTFYRYALFILSISALFLLSTATAFAAKTVTYTGTIQGAGCLQYHAVCPTSSKDPSIAIERDFVLQLNNGKTLYYMPNLDRSVKAECVGRTVRVTGTLGYHQINVTRLQLKGKDGYQTIWSKAQEQVMYAPEGK
jgi:hypothetical protein